MAGRLNGKIAIVTGGSRGIGAAIARSFAADGAKVVITSRKQDALDATAASINAQFDNAVIPRACHAGRSDDVSALVDWVEKEVGLPNVLVNNAATNPYFGPLMNVSWPAWDKTFEVNLKGYFEYARQVAQRLLKADQPGSIINVASVAGLRGAPFQGVYAMTKAAVISMTQTMAVELGGANIRSNAICPGLVETRLASAIVDNPATARYFTDRAALKRHAQPEEMVGLAVFLASDESSYLTGQAICNDGGFTTA